VLPTGSRFREKVIKHRNTLFVLKLNRWAASDEREIKDKRRSANAIAGLLRANLFEEELHGSMISSSSRFDGQVRHAAANMLLAICCRQHVDRH
jgi:hypothetical protein